MNKYEIAQILREIGILIELSDPFPQKGFAYRRAARSIENVKNIKYYINNDKLEAISGVGPKIAKIVSQIALNGTSPYYENLKQKIPVSLFELLNIPGLNPRNLRILFEKLQIQTISQLKQAIEKNLIQDLKIIRPSTIKKIQKHLDSIQGYGYTLLYPKAFGLAQSFIYYLNENGKIKKIEITGQLRRKCEVISQLEFVGITSHPNDCMLNFANHPSIKEILDQKPNEITVKLKYGITAHLKFVPQNLYPWSLWQSTGSKKHISILLTEAKTQKIDLKNISSEKDIYSKLSMSYIHPEMRENCGEIEAAKKGYIPNLIEYNDIKGTFHCHTSDSDGVNSLEEMIKGARKMGWEYIGISDHSKSSRIAHGLNEERLYLQIQKIRKLDKKHQKFRIFSGIECDILKDGTLDFTDDILKELDFVIVSVHSLFNMEKKLMTKRLIKAIENPMTTIVGHLTGRLLRSRDPYLLNIPKIIDACIANGKIMELNSTPDRLDMDWRYWIQAKEKGLLCCINPDAHSISDLLYVQYGINMARKGWLEKENVINTRNAVEMSLFLNNHKLQ